MLEDIYTDPDSGQGGSEFIFDETADYSAPKYRGQANPTNLNPSNLTERRWRDPILSPGEEADLLRATKGPEPEASAAKNRLAQSFHRLVLKEVKPYCSDDGRNDDLIAAGMLGLWEAIDRFDLSRNNGLAAYAIPLIRGRIKKAAKAFNRNGWSGETRLQRLIYGNHDVTPEQASKVMNRPVNKGELEEARTQVLGRCSELEPYDTTEPGFEESEHDEEKKPGAIAVAPPCAVQRYATLTMYRGELLWTAAGLFLYRLVDDADRRAAQRLKEIGRRAYALELVARDRARSGGKIGSLFEELPLSKGWVVGQESLSRPPPIPPEKPKPICADLRKLGGRLNRGAITYHALRIEAFESRSPTHRCLTGHTPPCDPTARRYADRSFNIRRKKRSDRDWLAAYSKWGKPALHEELAIDRYDIRIRWYRPPSDTELADNPPQYGGIPAEPAPLALAA
jgi:RNA polymerase sigma factor (sigma-70 family)